MKTAKYTQFLFKKTNRGISRKKVEELKKNILKFGYDENYPILINEKFEILDGQHRFKASQELNIEINYNFVKHDTDEYMRSLNIVSSGWELMDYINSYANEGRETYVRLLKFKEDHKINTTVALIVFCPSSTSKDIRSGKVLKVNQNAKKIMNLLQMFSDLDFGTKKSFVLAICSFFSKNPTPEQIEKLVKYRLVIQEMANTPQFLIVFENIINRHVKTNKICLL
ncbi:ParB/RepB/Spo0J family partition protein [Flavobacterium psychrophilum]|uniref:ParB/RepB/Spo0J family partition protein n=1 Tax=Flavobacterium psychrophilum TaxID=96345 RepID=UPI001068E714|nr:ParB/RepB/Spo0J family partition protein [Flavobacterium psychrophilum]MCB6230839.1 ParB/RepB/Spo0J family partition protein [Flavobacterium psychrophilum]MEB3380764.1 ParB/RepB/Spo0J family partition protein [Flavobacterium psychrophilum]